MKRESFKKYIIKMLAISTELEGANQNDLTLITPIGIITGRLPSDEVSEIVSPDTFISIMTGKFQKQYFKENELENVPLGENDGALILKDVQIFNDGLIFKANELVIFYDQIIGVTIGAPLDTTQI